MRCHVLCETLASQFVIFCTKLQLRNSSYSVRNFSFIIHHILYETLTFSQCVIMFCTKPWAFHNVMGCSVQNLIFTIRYVLMETSSTSQCIVMLYAKPYPIHNALSCSV
ncbi:hypothetical protein CDAR_4081 [Caerostris darwini]|uniref:Uncharacterized protein n=1 Tax=Caerostris darwini TaxID=1538125 RepID=A0AAV4WWA0_9ARAC|nr:hypothetical protein CDAR_4081 [Caerostris darwini]